MESKYKSFTNQQLIDEFNEIYKQSGVSKSNINMYVRNHYHDLYAEIEKRTIKLNQYKKTKTYNGKTLPLDVSMFERLYCLKHNLNDRPMCKACGKRLVAGFNKQKNQYSEFCSQYCERHSSECAQKGMQTKRRIYGDDNIVNQKKAYQTRIDKYGSYNPKDFLKKIRKTKKDKYGNEKYVNVEKIKQTVEKHKAENPDYYYDREQKTKQTKIANGHDPNWNNRKKFKQTVSQFTDEKKQQIKDKRKQTCLDEYGVESIAKLDEVKNAKKITCKEKYGVESTLQLPYIRENGQIAVKQKAWQHLLDRSKDIEPLFTKEEFLSCNLGQKTKLWRWRCKKCGHEFTKTWANWVSRRCPRCHPQNYHGMQDELHEYIKSICPENAIRYDCRSILNESQELDIYIEDLGIAIEFNGLFWHNSDYAIYGKQPIPMMYHYNKTEECNERGIRLVHVFEDEWYFKQKLCKSMLKKIIQPSTMRHIDASKCSISQIASQFEKEHFLIKYSFYGVDGSSIAYGLLYNQHLVAMMTFSKTRNNKQYEWQILNYVEVNSFIVDGGFNKLYDAFVQDAMPKSICMYVSRDWNTSRDFAECLRYVKTLDPKLYWTTCDRQRMKGTSITSANANSILCKYDSTKSFKQNMNDNGYYRIYDSGTLVFCQ